MFHKAVNLELMEGTRLEVTFRTGEVKSYDMSRLFEKYPATKALLDRELFLKGKLVGSFGIVWNDEIDLEVESVYEYGDLIKTIELPANYVSGDALLAARAKTGISQKELAALTGIDQSDISKIERGIANPSVSTLRRLAKAMNMQLRIAFEEI